MKNILHRAIICTYVDCGKSVGVNSFKFSVNYKQICIIVLFVTNAEKQRNWYIWYGTVRTLLHVIRPNNKISTFIKLWALRSFDIA